MEFLDICGTLGIDSSCFLLLPLLWIGWWLIGWLF